MAKLLSVKGLADRWLGLEAFTNVNRMARSMEHV